MVTTTELIELVQLRTEALVKLRNAVWRAEFANALGDTEISGLTARTVKLADIDRQIAKQIDLMKHEGMSETYIRHIIATNAQADAYV